MMAPSPSLVGAVAALDPKAMRATLAELDRVDARDSLVRYAPYPKQRLFHEMGATKRIRALFGGNQSGKSVCGAAEMAFHLTGRYPKRGQVFYPAFCHDGSPHPLALQDAWPNGWTGHRFKRPIKAWASGLTALATRDNAQTKLVGPPEQEHLWGTGTIPADAIVGTPSRSRGTANALDSVTVRHASGGLSTLWFKSYEQGRRNWQGPTLDCMSFDEEPPSDIWAEGTTRCNAVHDARIWATFTPLEGLSEVVTLLMAGRPLKALFNVD